MCVVWLCETSRAVVRFVYIYVQYYLQSYISVAVCGGNPYVCYVYESSPSDRNVVVMHFCLGLDQFLT